MPKSKPTLKTIRTTARRLFWHALDGRLMAVFYDKATGKYWLSVQTTNSDEEDDLYEVDQDHAKALYHRLKGLQGPHPTPTGVHQP